MTKNAMSVQWELELSKIRTYPLRMAFLLLTLPSIVWVPFYAVLPTVVLLLVPVIAQEIYGGDVRPAATVLLIVCLCLGIATILMSRSYAQVGYEVDREADTLRLIPSEKLQRDIQKNAMAAPEDLQTDLENISRIEFFTLLGYKVARVQYPGRTPENPYAFVVPSHRYSEVESLLQSAGVTLSSDVGLPIGEKFRARWHWFVVLVVSICVLVVVPAAMLVTIV